MDYLPAFLSITDQPCLIVGGGDVAYRKLALLLQAGGKVTVLAPETGPGVDEWGKSGRITIRRKYFAADDLRGFTLVISATNNTAVNTEVAAAARQHRIPVNVVDSSELSTFIFPAIIDRSPIIAAVSSGGRSPVLARLLRTRIESIVPASYGRLAHLAERFRMRVKTDLETTVRRRRFWEKTLQGPVAELIFAGREQEAEAKMESMLRAETDAKSTAGEVYLVGAGPGDPDLLTFRALRLMQQADTVVYDRLVSPEVLALVRRDAEKIYAGKTRSQHTIPQEKINHLLARLARSGKCVVRLKGGDPFIFGRGGEEIETLMEQSIPFQIVPGITAASGCASYAGIPLTHRDYAQSCLFVTGHLKDGSIDLNWKQMTVPNQTLVIYMGLLGLQQLCGQLIRHGSSPNLPAALIEQGTTPKQRVITGTLRTLPKRVETEEVRAPTLIIVGNVVRLHDRLAWFETNR
jgi:uroporphyrin-III C-methyltransferase / precorrin-2 dehydrogenase / sirohydrochlorin ferrochelatase